MVTNKHGMDLLQDPSLNKSTAFTEAEKQALGIVGLVPDVTESMDVQLNRVRMQLGQKTTDLDRYIRTLAPTAPEFLSASCSCIPHAPASRRNTCFRCISTPAPTMSNTCTILFTWVCARPARPRRNSIPSLTSSWRRYRRCFRNAASISRTGPEWTPSICWSVTATNTVYTMMTCKARRE